MDCSISDPSRSLCTCVSTYATHVFVGNTRGICNQSPRGIVLFYSTLVTWLAIGLSIHSHLCVLMSPFVTSAFFSVTYLAISCSVIFFYSRWLFRHRLCWMHSRATYIPHGSSLKSVPSFSSLTIHVIPSRSFGWMLNMRSMFAVPCLSYITACGVPDGVTPMIIPISTAIRTHSSSSSPLFSSFNITASNLMSSFCTIIPGRLFH